MREIAHGGRIRTGQLLPRVGREETDVGQKRTSDGSEARADEPSRCFRNVNSPKSAATALPATTKKRTKTISCRCRPLLRLRARSAALTPHFTASRVNESKSCMTPLGQTTTRGHVYIAFILAVDEIQVYPCRLLPHRARQDLCPEKVSDYIRLRETLSVRPIFGPSYCSHTATTTATKAATTIKAFLSSRPGWLASVPERE